MATDCITAFCLKWPQTALLHSKMATDRVAKTIDLILQSPFRLSELKQHVADRRRRKCPACMFGLRCWNCLPQLLCVVSISRKQLHDANVLPIYPETSTRGRRPSCYQANIHTRLTSFLLSTNTHTMSTSFLLSNKYPHEVDVLPVIKQISTRG